MKKVKRKVGNFCCVVGCRNTYYNSTGLTFYRFPIALHKIEQREKWIKAVKRINPDGSPWVPSKHSTICSKHFEGNKKSEHPMSPSFVPTIFPDDYLAKKTTNNSTQRFQRCLKRSEKNKTIENDIANQAAVLEENEPILNEEVACVTYKDADIQVEFWDNRRECSQNIFICTQIVYGEKCDAATQANLCVSKSEKSVAKMIETKENSFGTDVSFRSCEPATPVEIEKITTERTNSDETVKNPLSKSMRMVIIKRKAESNARPNQKMIKLKPCSDRVTFINHSDNKFVNIEQPKNDQLQDENETMSNPNETNSREKLTGFCKKCLILDGKLQKANLQIMLLESKINQHMAEINEPKTQLTKVGMNQLKTHTHTQSAI